jgi:integrase/recombinase XerD
LLASLVEHKSIATTQAYIDVNDEMKRGAVELVTLAASAAAASWS